MVVNSPTQSPKVAFLGLGAMGFAMSTHLVRQGIPVTGFDIWPPTIEKFKTACSSIPEARYDVSTSPAEAVKDAQIVLLMVATHHHVNSALFDPEIGAVKTIPQNATIAIMSTVPPTYPLEVRKRLDTEFGRSDIKVIDAPVSGGVARSLNGTLTIMSSSDDSSNLTNPNIRIVLSNLSNNGKTLYAIPGTLGSGTSAKALNQVMCGIHIVGGSEIMALAALNGVNTTSFFEAATAKDSQTNKSVYGWTWMFENRAPRMLDPTLPIASAISIINKDVGIIKDEETRLSITLPLVNTTHTVLSECMSRDLASIDDALITQYYLGMGTERQDLVVTQSTVSASASDTIQTLLQAHAIINFVSAYETTHFAQALELTSPTQRGIWFDIIAGAAGGSTVFSEVIPLAFTHMPDWQAGFKEYAVTVCKNWELDGVARLIQRAKSQDFQPVLLETALDILTQQLK